MKKRGKKKRKLKNKNLKKLFGIPLRYLILILVALPELFIFYFIFTPLTIYPVYFLLGLFFEVAIFSNIYLLVNNVPIELISACIAGSAYYLLLVLNLATPKIKLKTRISAILFSFIAFLILNILRIFVLGSLAATNFPYFDVTHSIFWYGFSTIIVVAIWFIETKIYKIKEIPFYSDIKYLYKESLKKK